MGLRRHVEAILWLGLAGGFTAACETPELPGESSGSFEIVSLLNYNRCGIALGSRGTFRAELRREENGQAYWRTVNAPVVSGVVVDDRYHFEIGFSQAAQAAGNAGLMNNAELNAGTGPNVDTGQCTLQRVETLSVRLNPSSNADAPDADSSDAGLPDRSEEEATSETSDASTEETTDMALEGTHRIELTPVSGSFCDTATATLGGPYTSLPCDLEYELRGTALPNE